MNKRPIIITHPNSLCGRKIILRIFAHGGRLYEVRLQNRDGSQFATLNLAGSQCECALHPLPDKVPTGFSADAVQAAYITVAEWLVKTGRWPDAKTLIQYEDEASAAQVA